MSVAYIFKLEARLVIYDTYISLLLDLVSKRFSRRIYVVFNRDYFCLFNPAIMSDEYIITKLCIKTYTYPIYVTKLHFYR